MATKKLFAGKDTRQEEMREAQALRSGRTTIKDYLTGERSEGRKGSAKTAKAVKTGRMSPQQYAAKEAGGKRR